MTRGTRSALSHACPTHSPPPHLLPNPTSFTSTVTLISSLKPILTSILFAAQILQAFSAVVVVLVTFLLLYLVLGKLWKRCFEWKRVLSTLPSVHVRKSEDGDGEVALLLDSNGESTQCVVDSEGEGVEGEGGGRGGSKIADLSSSDHLHSVCLSDSQPDGISTSAS